MACSAARGSARCRERAPGGGEGGGVILRRSFPLIASTVVFAISGYAVNVFLGRHLGPADYGVFGLLTSIMSGLNVMQVSGPPQAMSKFIAEDVTHSDDVLVAGARLQVWFGLALVAICAAVSPGLATLFHDSRLVPYLLITALVFPGYGLFAAYAGYYNGLHRFGRQACVNAAYALAKLVLVIALALILGLAGALIGYVLATVVAVLAGFHPAKRRNVFESRRLMALSRPLVVFSALSFLQYSVDLFTVKAVVHAPAATGYYVAAQNISVIPYLGLAALAQVLLPTVSRLLAVEGREAAGLAVGNAMRLLLLLLLPVTALIIGSAPEVLRLLFGAAYAPAAPTLRVMAFGYVAVTAFAQLASVLNGAGRATATMTFAGIGLAVTFAMCVILVPHHGLVAAAASTGTGAAVATLCAAVATRRLVPVSLGAVSTLRILVGTGVVLALAWLPVPTWALVPWWPALLVLYGTLLLLLGEFSPAERQQVRTLLRVPRRRAREGTTPDRPARRG